MHQCRNCQYIDTCKKWRNEDYYFLNGCEEHTPVKTITQLGKSVKDWDNAMKQWRDNF